MKSIIKRLQGKRSQRKGEALELIVLNRLRSAGCFVERIATPVRMIAGKPRRTAKVFGDIIGLNQHGKGLLVECKNRGRIPRPSDFAPHQRKTLIEWEQMGGVALVAYELNGEITMMNASYILLKD